MAPGGGRDPAALVQKQESVVTASHRCLAELGLTAKSLWAVEHVYPIYNRRFDCMMLIPVFAAEVDADDNITLDWEHSEARWCTVDECQQPSGAAETLLKIVSRHPEVLREVMAAS